MTAARMVLVGAWTLVMLPAGCRRPSTADDGEGSAAPRPARRVRCEPVRSVELRDTLDIRGTIAPLPDRDAQIAAQVAGRIERVLVREGDVVRRHQPLARIEDAGLRDQAAEASALLAKARAETHLAGTTRARVQRVFDRGIAARQELEEATARQATAEANEAEAKAAAEITNRQLERATVRSPLRGVVLKVFRRTGELVDGTAATPVVEVGDPSSLELVGTAAAADLVRSRVGAMASIEVPALPALRWSGKVSAVSPAVDRGTGLGVVRVSMILSGPLAPPVGVTGTAHIASGAPRMVMAVSESALRGAAGAEAEVVICGADKRAHVVRVLRGGTQNGATEVRPLATQGGDGGSGGGGGLSPIATRVVVDTVLGIEDGDALEVAPGSPAMPAASASPPLTPVRPPPAAVP